MMTSSNGNIFRVLAICAGNSPVPGEFPAHRPVTGSLMISLIYVWMNGWVNTGEAGDMRRYRAHYDVIVMHFTALGLMDSPIGLAGYIMEKFSTWTNPDFRQLPDGGLSSSYSLDDLISNVAIYWFTGSIGPSMRLYKKVFADERYDQLDRFVIRGLFSVKEISSLVECFNKTFCRQNYNFWCSQWWQFRFTARFRLGAYIMAIVSVGYKYSFMP